MTEFRVLIPDRLQANPDIEQTALGEGTCIILGRTANADEIPTETWNTVDAVLAWHEIRLTADVIERLHKCRVIVRAGVGFDNVDLAAAGRRGIPVCNVPDYGTGDVADHALALLLTLARGIVAFNDAVRAQAPGHWTWGAAGPLHRIAGSTLGVVGLGRIGSAVALRAKAFGMRVIFFDPYVNDGYDKSLGIMRTESLDELLPQSDFVTLHTPLSDETRLMANDRFFDRMKPGAILVNTARGGIVDTSALERALRSGRLRAGGFDVLETEPADSAHPLIAAWRDGESWLNGRLVITPHAAFVCEEAYRELRTKAALEVRRVLTNNPPRNCVNRAWLV